MESISEQSIDRLCGCIEQQSHDYICLNDPEDLVDCEQLADRLKASFEKMLPDKSQFEK